MRRGKRSYEERARRALLDLWSGLPSFGKPLGCVASSYTFDAGHFEEHCLARFLAMQTDANEAAAAYAIEREERMVECPAWVFVDQAHARGTRSLRWNLLPIGLPGGGIQHAKISVLAWENAVRVIVASANLTPDGYRRNQECAGVLDFTAESGVPRRLLVDAIAFLERLRTFARGYDRPDAGPQANLGKFLLALRRRAEQLPEGDDEEVRADLVPLLPGERGSIVDRLFALWDQGGRASAGKTPPRPDTAVVLSPFYNEGDDAVKVARTLAAGMAKQGERTIAFQGPGHLRDTKVLELGMPESLKRPQEPRTTHEFDWIDEQVTVDGATESRPLHAKSIWLERDARALHMIGSSNFTLAGLGLHPRHNIELNLAYSIKDSGGPFAKLCDSACPDATEVEDLDTTQFKALASQSEGGQAAEPMLPAAFGLALYRRIDGKAVLELEITSDAPRPFKISSTTGLVLADDAAWKAAGTPSLWTIPCTEPRPPSMLKVEWPGEGGERCEAYWIVNAGGVNDLPPPAELRDLTLAELLEVLSSAKPLHEAISAVLEKRAERARTVELSVDPHDKVDTSQFLLQRMRRLSRALEGLAERLAQPVRSLDALDWRLNGPVGPMALARQLLATEREAAAFMVAEVAQVLKDAQIPPSEGVSADAIQSRLRAAITELRDLAADARAEGALATYVEKTFAECLA